MSALGVGIGWRPDIAGYVRSLPGLRFTEVVAESLHHPLPDLLALRDNGVAVIPHGIQLSLGGPDPVSPARVAHLAHCAELLDAPLVSEHIAFVRAGGLEAGHLLPVPRTRDSLQILTANIRRTQRELPVPLALEPIAALFDWHEADYTEADFITELLLRTDALLLLDIANVYANARNRGQDPTALLDRLPLDRIAYVHVAGGAQAGGLYHDTHTDPVPADVLALITELCTRCRPPGLLLERDGRYPPAAALSAELAAIAQAADLPSPTTGPAELLAPELESLIPVPKPAPTRDPGTTGLPPAPRPTLSDPKTPPGRTMTSDPTSEPQSESSGAPQVGGSGADMAGLVEALVAGGQIPEGFDEARVTAAAQALLRKRADGVARAWPMLARSYGQGWQAEFAAWAAGRPGRGSWLDGWDFARGRTVPQTALVELAACEVRWTYDPERAPKARRLAVRRYPGGMAVNLFGRLFSL